MSAGPGAAFLAARDAREEELRRALALARERGAGALLAVSGNVPGPDKHRPGLAGRIQKAVVALAALPALEPVFAGRDLLGPFHLLLTGAAPGEAKRLALALETGPGGRLLDLDVYDLEGRQLDRAALGLPERPCLLCPEPARACIRLGRHGAAELLARVDQLLREDAAQAPIRPEALVPALVLGARRELDLTPKPGLVDRRDAGSHPDLSHALMAASIDLLPAFYADLLACVREPEPFRAVIRAGQEAEARMLRAIRANAHKGYIFLSGLVLLGACAGDGGTASLRAAAGGFARAFFAEGDRGPGHGAGLRRLHPLGGVRAEAEQGLPSVFECGWPAYRQALGQGWAPERAGHYLMAVLMQRVEDTTAVHRCGLGALERLRRDGAGLQRGLERGEDLQARLAGLNEDYRRAGLTMGGVADCMALTFALQACFETA